MEFMRLENQLENYFMDVRSSKQFSNLDEINDRLRMMVDTKKHVYPMLFTSKVFIAFAGGYIN